MGRVGCADIVLNGLVFCANRSAIAIRACGNREYSLRQLLLYGALFSGIVIVLRMIWMFPGAVHRQRNRTRCLHIKPWAGHRHGSIFVVGWTGMRGVVALAAAISLPETPRGRKRVSAAQPDHFF